MISERLPHDKHWDQSLQSDIPDDLQVGYCVIDAGKRIAVFNKAVEIFLGLDLNTHTGMIFNDVVESNLKKLFDDPDLFASVVLGEKNGTGGNECHVFKLKSIQNEYERWFEYRRRRIQVGRYAGGYIDQYIDITDRKAIERILKGLNDTLLSFGADPDQNINRLVGFCGMMINAETAMYSRIESEMLCTVGQWHTPPDYNPVDRMKGHICSDVISNASDEIVIIRNLQKTPYGASDPNVKKYGLETYFGKAVKTELRCEGALCLVFKGDYQPKENDKWLLNVVGSAIAVEEQRRSAELKLQSSEREKAAILNSVSELVLYLDVDMRIKWANEMSATTFGIPTKELIGEKCHEIWYKREEPCEDCPVLKSLESGVPEIDEFKTYDNKTWTIRGYPVLSRSGDITGVVEVARDITGSKQLEKQFIQAQKMETVGRLAGGIAHDFNNLLSVIIGYSDMLILKTPESSTSYREIEEIRRTAERAGNLTRQLLAFSNRQIIEPQTVRVNDLLINVDKMLRRMIGADVEFVTLTEENLWYVRVDVGQMEQVLTNLIVNARDAMPEGGKLTIKTENLVTQEDMSSQMGDIESGEYVLLTVSDTGIGMNEQTLERVFEPFFTTKEQGKGTGLGLSTCYGIVKQNKGNIIIESSPGDGTTVCVLLPRMDKPLCGSEEKKSVNTDSVGTETLLLVEDEIMLNEMLAQALKRRGYNVLQAFNGEEALRIIYSHSGEPIHMVISDIVMPQMGGRELLNRLKKEYPELDMLMISGYTGDFSGTGSDVLPDIDFLQKPFTSSAFTKKVRQILDKESASP